MSFRKNAKYIEVLIIISCAFALDLLFVFLFGSMDLEYFGTTILIYCSAVLLLEMGTNWRMLSDTVYYDIQGIKFQSRKSTITYLWPEVKQVKRIMGTKGALGWMIITTDGKKYKCYPRNNEFISYVRTEVPDVEIKM